MTVPSHGVGSAFSSLSKSFGAPCSPAGGPRERGDAGAPHPAGLGDEGAPGDTPTSDTQDQLHQSGEGLGSRRGLGAPTPRGRTEAAAGGTPRQVPPPGRGNGAENAPLMTPMSPWGSLAAGAIPEPWGGGGEAAGFRPPSPPPPPQPGPAGRRTRRDAPRPRPAPRPAATGGRTLPGPGLRALPGAGGGGLQGLTTAHPTPPAPTNHPLPVPVTGSGPTPPSLRAGDATTGAEPPPPVPAATLPPLPLPVTTRPPPPSR